MNLFEIGFLTFTLFDFIDIMLVSLLFYWIYKSLKDTIAVQILFGMVIILALSFITEALNLKSINWILRTVSDIWLLAFVVLFQPELRKLMLLITRSKIFQIFVKSKISETIDEVIEATLEMSSKHIGGLVVFTRTQNVQMTIDTGVSLQAKVTKELLISIFNPKSPLHDGAVIIDNQLISAAKCVLPLSTAKKVNGKVLGTRHRAALGLSEQIDAVVLVVSEETGAISIAENGEFSIDISPENLPSALSQKLSED